MKKTFMIATIIVIGIIAGIAYMMNGREKPCSTCGNHSSKTGNKPSVSESLRTDTVSLYAEEDVIRNFFRFIGEKRIPEAISLMTTPMIGEESSKQAWGANFNAINSAKQRLSGAFGGAFLVNEFGQVIVPSLRGMSRLYVGKLQGTMLFENPFDGGWIDFRRSQRKRLRR